MQLLGLESGLAGGGGGGLTLSRASREGTLAGGSPWVAPEGSPVVALRALLPYSPAEPPCTFIAIAIPVRRRTG